jgi:hypothetical protein
LFLEVSNGVVIGIGEKMHDIRGCLDIVLQVRESQPIRS